MASRNRASVNDRFRAPNRVKGEDARIRPADRDILRLAGKNKNLRNRLDFRGFMRFAAFVVTPVRLELTTQ